MVTQNELKVFYETNLKPKLLFFEEQRKLLLSKRRILWNIYRILLIFAIFAVIIVIGSDEEYASMLFSNTGNREKRKILFVFAIIIYLIVFAIAVKNSYTNLKFSYQTHFKKAVVGPLVTFIDENLSYDPGDDATVKAFYIGMQFNKAFDTSQ
jgi:hypothetical protein